MAPKNKYGTIESLVSKDDGTVWVGDTLYYDSKTKTYFPDQDKPATEKKTEEEKYEVLTDLMIHPLHQRFKKERKRRRRKGRGKPCVHMKDSIAEVGKGTCVNIF